LLLFSRGKALKLIEDGLHWKAAGTSVIPTPALVEPEGVFVAVPVFYNDEQLDQYSKALEMESRYLLGNAKPGWVHLRGEGISGLPIDRVRAIVQAACPDARSIGLDINPGMLGPGDIAGYRSMAVERFNFRVNSQFTVINEPVRRARALGAFTSVEVCLCEALSGRMFLQAIEKALEASPGQVCISDERCNGIMSTDLMEKAGELVNAAGFRRVSAWAWTQTESSFDSLGIILSGRSINLGPGAAACYPVVCVNPDTKRWLETRLSGSFEVIRAEGKVENWLGLAAGLYTLELHKDNLDCKMHRHVTALQRMGVVDRKGKPSRTSSMEFCHHAARAARQVVLGGSDSTWKAAEKRGVTVIGRRSVSLWKTGSRGL
jgi:hypothetical protein